MNHNTRGEALPDFVDTAVKEIDDQLRALKDEAARLEAARAALTGGTPRRGRSARNGAARSQARSTRGRSSRSTAAPRGGRSNTRALEALELVRKQPGITILVPDLKQVEEREQIRRERNVDVSDGGIAQDDGAGVRE